MSNATTEEPMEQPVPAWAWFFAAACGLAGTAAVCSPVHIAAALAGAAACLGIACNDAWSLRKRVGLCALSALLCWGCTALMWWVASAMTI